MPNWGNGVRVSGRRSEKGGRLHKFHIPTILPRIRWETVHGDGFRRIGSSPPVLLWFIQLPLLLTFDVGVGVVVADPVSRFCVCWLLRLFFFPLYSMVVLPQYRETFGLLARHYLNQCRGWCRCRTKGPRTEGLVLVSHFSSAAIGNAQAISRFSRFGFLRRRLTL